jgi:hypothetical protein
MAARPSAADLDLQKLKLPSLDSFTDDERRLAQVTVGIVRAGGAMYTGRFLECVVAGLLKARFPRTGVSTWDLVTSEDIRIEVKSGTTRFSLGDGKDVHVWVFVHKRERGSDLAFTVASSKEVRKLGRSTVSASRLIAHFDEVGAADLRREVARAARRQGLRTVRR